MTEWVRIRRRTDYTDMFVDGRTKLNLVEDVPVGLDLEGHLPDRRVDVDETIVEEKDGGGRNKLRNVHFVEYMEECPLRRIN